MSVVAETVPRDVMELARELGLEAELGDSDLPWLLSLLDDEAERLDAASRKRLRDQLGDRILNCSACGNLFLRCYQPDEDRCRACSARLAPRPAEGAAALDPRLNGQSTGPPGWGVETQLTCGRKIVLDEENEDWDERLARVEKTEAPARRLAEERQRLMERASRSRPEPTSTPIGPQAHTQLPAQVTPEHLRVYKQKARQRIEERIQERRRQRRLLRRHERL